MRKAIKRNILLNPGPVTTTDGVKQALLTPDICHREQAFKQILQQIRKDLLKVVHAGADYTAVLFGASGTGALEACISSVVPENKKIMIINNGSYGQRLVDIANRYHMKVVALKFSVLEPLSLSIIENQLKEDKDIQFCAMVHHETCMGILNPLREIGDICKRQNKHFIVDAMSSFAGTDINVYDDNIDFIISSANKCLHGMPGLSFVICKKNELCEKKNNARSYYFDLYQQYHALETSGEMPFTPPVQVAYALKQALIEYFAQGGEERRMKYHTNYTHLAHGLIELGFKIITPEALQSKLLLTVQFPSNGVKYNFDHIHDYLYARGYTIYPKKVEIANTFRLSCIGDLTKQDIDGFLQELKIYMIKTHESDITQAGG